MSKQQIEKLLHQALDACLLGPFDVSSVQIEATKDKAHGDYASNIALVLAKQAKKPPRILAEELIGAIPSSPLIAKIELAGPGFINFFLTDTALHTIVPSILSAGDTYGHTKKGQGKKILVEFVSSNPTGPLHVGHGRHAAFGAVVSDLLETIGYKVHREYYVNDAGRQMDILTVSTWLRYLEKSGAVFSFPANGYKGEYVTEIAAELEPTIFFQPVEKVFSDLPLDEQEGGNKEVYIDALIERAKKLLGAHAYQIIFDHTLKSILSDIESDLAEFGVYFDEWFSERALVQTDIVDRLIAILKEHGRVYEKEGALWFRSTDFNDEKDRVLQRSNGQRTYFANDLAYHVHKFERGFDEAIDIFGSDHHGYVPRMKAGLEAFGILPKKLTYLLLQFVTLYRGQSQVQMSTRSGSFVTLRELRQEVGNDAARFFYVMRKYEQHIDFDLELAKTQSNENPMYYIQYAHARICSVFKQLEEKNLIYSQEEGLKQLERLQEPSEKQLMRTLSRYQDVIISAAEQHEPHILTNYLRDLSADFHSYYNNVVFLVDESSLRNARLILILATRQVIANGLKLIGVSTPDSM